MSFSRATASSELLAPDRQRPAPPVFLRKLRRAAVAVGCDIRLRVRVDGHPRPSLRWYHDDMALAADDQDYGGLWIRDCQQVDSGLYTCVATNNLGEARTCGPLAVLDLGQGRTPGEQRCAGQKLACIRHGLKHLL
uniref:Ig-like domain-containing protein n=1 Tax=Electrophorus electricus TaxID=8005 RepID=A0AAY5ERD6_ELEEL